MRRGDVGSAVVGVAVGRFHEGRGGRLSATREGGEGEKLGRGVEGRHEYVARAVYSHSWTNDVKRSGGRSRRTAAESKRGTSVESALAPTFQCRRQWQSQFLVASVSRRHRGALSV